MKEKWSEIIENLRNMLNSGMFRVWVAPLEGSANEDGLQILAPNGYIANWLKRNLLETLRQAASPILELSPDDIKIDISVKPEKAAQKSVSSREIMDAIQPLRMEQTVLPLKLPSLKPEMEWKYCFDDFVTGPSNNMAVAAARDMCEHGQVRTLFVNAAPGLGKTHLAHASGQFLSKTGEPLKVGYLTAEQFASRYVVAMRGKELEEYKQHLSSLDVLLFEDVHFLQGKMKMQEMMLGVIKNLQARGARVIFTSSFSPRQMQDIDGQLISHFCSGILTNMDKPNQQMRQEILRRKARIFQVAMPDEVCNLLSSRISSDVRQLESCLTSMIFKARLLNSGLTIDLAMETLGQYADAENIVDIDSIVRLVCESFGLSKMQLCSKSRRKEYVRGRNTVFYLARKHTDLSLEEIGCIFNRRHSTVNRSITQVEEELARESRSGRQFAHAVSLIESKCGINHKHP